MAKYNNIPADVPANSASLTIQAFNQYLSTPIELKNSDVMALTAFFENRGFDSQSAESTALVILQQANKDGINPMQIMDTMRGLDGVQIGGIVTEILNYNRLKTSVIGQYTSPIPSEIVLRNIIA